MTEPISPTMTRAFEDADLLISYAANMGLLGDHELVQDLVSARKKLSKDGADPEAEVQFWETLSKVAAMVRPATTEGLRATRGMFDGLNPGERWRHWLFPSSRRLPVAETAIGYYQKLAIAALVVLVVVQIYYVVGAAVVADMDRMLNVAAAASPTGQQIAPVTDQVVLAALPPFRVAPGDESNLQLFTSHRVLNTWNQFWLVAIAFIPLPSAETIKLPIRVDASDADKALRPMCMDEDPSCRVGSDLTQTRANVGFGLPFDYGTTIARYEDLTKARFALASLQYYILPFLYGLLGTCVYILRNLSEELRNRSFSSDVPYRLRVPLGALAGVTIAMVAIPDNSVELSKTLPPLALALVAGYAVEVLFAAMDRFIAAFSNDQSIGYRGTLRGGAR